MKKGLTPELKALKEEYDFLHKKIGELEWERATLFYGKKAIKASESEDIQAQLDNYRENMGLLLEKVHRAVREANQAAK